jgi:hypothetical protein
LTLWKNGQITMADLDQDAKRGKTTTRGIRKAVNKMTGKESMKALAFGDVNWGERSREYMLSIVQLPERAWEKILKGALDHLKSADRSRDGSRSTSCGPGEGDGNDDKRTQLVYISDSEEVDERECVIAVDARTHPNGAFPI